MAQYDPLELAAYLRKARGEGFQPSFTDQDTARYNQFDVRSPEEVAAGRHLDTTTSSTPAAAKETLAEKIKNWVDPNTITDIDTLDRVIYDLEKEQDDLVASYKSEVEAAHDIPNSRKQVELMLSLYGSGNTETQRLIRQYQDKLAAANLTFGVTESNQLVGTRAEEFRPYELQNKKLFDRRVKLLKEQERTQGLETLGQELKLREEYVKAAELRAEDSKLSAEQRSLYRQLAAEERQKATLIEAENRQLNRQLAAEERDLSRTIGSENRATQREVAREARAFSEYLNRQEIEEQSRIRAEERVKIATLDKEKRVEAQRKLEEKESKEFAATKILADKGFTQTDMDWVRDNITKRPLTYTDVAALASNPSGLSMIKQAAQGKPITSAIEAITSNSQNAEVYRRILPTIPGLTNEQQRNMEIISHRVEEAVRSVENSSDISLFSKTTDKDGKTEYDKYIVNAVTDEQRKARIALRRSEATRQAVDTVVAQVESEMLTLDKASLEGNLSATTEEENLSKKILTLLQAKLGNENITLQELIARPEIREYLRSQILVDMVPSITDVKVITPRIQQAWNKMLTQMVESVNKEGQNIGLTIGYRDNADIIEARGLIGDTLLPSYITRLLEMGKRQLGYGNTIFGLPTTPAVNPILDTANIPLSTPRFRTEDR